MWLRTRRWLSKSALTHAFEQQWDLPPPKTRLRYNCDDAWVLYGNDRWKRLLVSVGATLIFDGAAEGSEA